MKLTLLLSFSIAWHLSLTGFASAAELRPKKVNRYTSFENTELLPFLNVIVQGVAKDIDPKLKEPGSLIAEARALISMIHQYNLRAPAHHTDGWSDFQVAEWPYMTMIYTGLSLCRLSLIEPSFSKEAKREVRHILDAVKTQAVSGFVAQHFGHPFPKPSKNIDSASTFVHGHYLYLALKYRATFREFDEDEWIHAVALSLTKNFREQTILKSYKDMYYVADNFSSLAALKLYDLEFDQQNSEVLIQNLIHELRQHYLEPRSGIFATYLDLKHKKFTEGPRGISVMYAMFFLPEIDQEFAKTQWAAIKSSMLKSLDQLMETDLILKGLVTSMNLTGKEFMVCLEHPENPDSSMLDKNFSDGDSGPVLFGIGTSASAFAIGAAHLMGDTVTAEKLTDLALKIGAPIWEQEQLIYKNLFHEVGQAIVLYGKTQGLQIQKKSHGR